MPNFDLRRGCVPLRYDQTTYNYPVAPNNPAIGQGDPLERRVDGFLYPCTAASIFQPFGISATFVPANTGGEIPVYHVKADETTFMIQVGNNGIFADESAYTFNYDWFPGAPDPVTGMSTYQMDSIGINDIDVPVKVIKKVEFAYPDTNNFGELFIKVECVFNDLVFKSQGTLG